jgi:hypothetical protein
MAKFSRPSSLLLKPATCSLLLLAFCLVLMASKAFLARRRSPPPPKQPSSLVALPRICDGDQTRQLALPTPSNHSSGRDFWSVVNFPPVPAFHINNAHDGGEPWDDDRCIRDLAVRVLLPPSTSELVVDVGANVGCFSLMAAALGYDVVAIEPMSAKLRASIARNPGFDRRIRVVAAHVTLDDVVRQGDVALVRIDVGEGHEPAVLHGARHLLCHHTVRYVVVIGLSSMEENSGGCSPRRMLEFMQAVGYAISDVAPGAPRLMAASSFPPNVLFTLADDALRRRACGGAVD